MQLARVLAASQAGVAAPSVVLEAVSVLTQLACGRSHLAVAALQGVLEDEDEAVRMSALCALGQLCEQGDRRVVASVCGRLADQVVEVREMALAVLWHIAVALETRYIQLYHQHLRSCE